MNLNKEYHIDSDANVTIASSVAIDMVPSRIVPTLFVIKLSSILTNQNTEEEKHTRGFYFAFLEFHGPYEYCSPPTVPR